MFDNIIRLMRDPTAALGGAAAGAGVAGAMPYLAALQAGLGIYQTIAGKNKINKLLKQRKAYQTPQEVFDILNITESNAQQGFDPTTLAYLTNQIDRGFAGGLGAATRLGADPNQLSALLDQKIQGTMKVGAENHRLNMENMSRYLGALDSVAANKAAEQKSQQDIIKDQLQAAGVQVQSGTGNLSGGINTGIAAFASDKTANLYGMIQKLLQQTGGGSVTPQMGTMFASETLQTAPGVLPNAINNLNSNLMPNNYAWTGR